MSEAVRPGPSTLLCSFCGKDQTKVRKLVAGPGVYICDGCIELIHQVLQEDRKRSDSTTEQR